MNAEPVTAGLVPPIFSNRVRSKHEFHVTTWDVVLVKYLTHVLLESCPSYLIRILNIWFTVQLRVTFTFKHSSSEIPPKQDPRKSG